MKKHSQEYLYAAHRACSFNEQQILASTICGCFQCKKIFSPINNIEWIVPRSNKRNGTACCPYCYIDSILGDASGFPITQEFLEAMHKEYFAG